MPLTVRFRPEAQAEVREARDWYEARHSGLGVAFSEDLVDTVRSIAENPLRFSRVHQETRRAILTHFPYAVYFRLNGDDVVVLAGPWAAGSGAVETSLVRSRHAV